MIYIHIPFCRQKCSYCNFHFSTSSKLKEEMLFAIKKEIALRKDEMQDKTIHSLYFGGGTPSLFSPDEISGIIDEVLRYFSFDEKIEITLEANPDDLTSPYIRQLSKTHINRLSIGIQSFFDEDLVLMNRAHTAKEADYSVKASQDAGLENISTDLIYGTPTSNLEIWKKNLEKTIELNVPHISSYALTVEPKTTLENWISKGKIAAPKAAEQTQQFFYMTDFLHENGFGHYEISNFAKPGFYSKHNTSYWENKPYLGIGPSAHSFDGKNTRSWNIANNAIYIKKIENEEIPSEKEFLSEKERYNEVIMIGLRTLKGVDIHYLKNNFKEEIFTENDREIKRKIEQELLIVEDNFLKIPPKHWFLADGIASDLFLV